MQNSRIGWNQNRIFRLKISFLLLQFGFRISFATTSGTLSKGIFSLVQNSNHMDSRPAKANYGRHQGANQDFFFLAARRFWGLLGGGS